MTRSHCSYRQRVIVYGRILFTSFIAYSFGHTLGFAAFTGAAIRFRLYSTAKVTAIDVATISAFCSLSIGIGLTTLTGLSLLVTPEQASSLLHLQPAWAMLVGFLLLARHRGLRPVGLAVHERAGDQGLGAEARRARRSPSCRSCSVSST